MKIRPLYFAFYVLILFSCNRLSETHTENNQANSASDSPLKEVKLNTNGGYFTNQLTGDSIQPIINSYGDTVITGIAVPAEGKILNTDSLKKPKNIVAGHPIIVPTNTNIHKIPDYLVQHAVKAEKTKITIPGGKSVSNIIFNSQGDTIFTGVPILAKGKKVDCIQPQPVKALSPQQKDDTRIFLRYLDVDQGLNSSGGVRSVFEDSRGELWFGSAYDGVSKYNGKSFTQFTDKNGLSGNSIKTIFEDSKGNIWFGTGGSGISKYDGKTFIHFTEEEGLSSNFINCIYEDRNSDIWFGTNSGGVCRYDGESFYYLSKNEGLSGNSITTIMEDSAGNLWFGTHNDGICKFDGEIFTRFKFTDGYSPKTVCNIVEDKNGNIWFGTLGSGLIKFNGDMFTFYTVNEGLVNNNIWSLLEDKNGNLWIGTEGGVSKLQGNTFTSITEKEGLSNNYVLSIAEDSFGNIWFGTRDGGVNIYNGGKFQHFGENEGLTNNHAWSITNDSNGNIWFGTWRHGLSRYDGETFSHFTTKQGLINDLVRSILEDSKGNLWIGTVQGVSKYNGKSFTNYTTNEGLSNGGVISILEDSNGNIWMGTWSGGVNMYNGKVFKHFTEKEGLIKNLVYSILEDSKGNLWFGTSGGLSKYDGKTFTHYTEKEGLSNSFILSLYEDSRGNIWIGTFGGGANMFNGKTFTYLTEKDGLKNNNVESIIEDNSANIWLGTTSGLNQIVFNQNSDSCDLNKNQSLQENPVILSLNKQDGLNGLEFMAGSVTMDSENRIWWTSVKGLTMLGMNGYQPPITPPVYLKLNHIEVNGEFIDFQNINEQFKNEIKYDAVADFGNYPLNLNLPYNKNHLTFHFSAINWSSPHQIKYRFKIQGIDENWSQANDEAKADYRSLSQGTHTFMVQSVGASGTWSAPLEYTFTIKPPFWDTLLARIIYIILFICFIYVIIYVRTNQLRERKIELEKEVGNRTRDLKVAQSKLVQSEKMASLGVLTAGIAHEINNPINFVVNGSNAIEKDYRYLKELMNSLDISGEKKSKYDYDVLIDSIPQLISDVKMGANRIAEIVKGLSIFSRIEGSKKSLMNIHEGLDSTLVLLRHKTKGKIEIIKNYDLKKPDIICYGAQLNQVFMNIISNAIDAFEKKQADKQITVSTRQDKETIIISICDNGIGIPVDIKDKIFDPFYTTKEVGEGVGLGLSISQGIMEQQGGKIEVKSEQGKGTEFLISVPL